MNHSKLILIDSSSWEYVDSHNKQMICKYYNLIENEYVNLLIPRGSDLISNPSGYRIFRCSYKQAKIRSRDGYLQSLAYFDNLRTPSRKVIDCIKNDYAELFI